MQPIPRDSEKNICPAAVFNTLIRPISFNASRSGLNMNSRPTKAPSKVTLRITTISIIINNAGMATVVNFSIPPEIPPITMMIVAPIKIA